MAARFRVPCHIRLKKLFLSRFRVVRHGPVREPAQACLAGVAGGREASLRGLQQVQCGGQGAPPAAAATGEQRPPRSGFM